MSTFQGIYTNYAGEYESRGQSGLLWKDCPGGDLNIDLNRGYFFLDDFLDLPTGKYTATQATTGTFALSDEEGGVALADSGSTTEAQGINVQLGSTVGEFAATQTAGKLWFEARVKASDITDSGTQKGPEFFCGLSAIDTSVIAASANSSTDHIGFESVSDDNVLLFHTENGGNRTSSTATIHTFADDEYVKLGFRVTNQSKIEVYVNGAKVDTLTTNICTALMVPTLVCQSGGTTDPIVGIDWWSVAVEQSAS